MQQLCSFTSISWLRSLQLLRPVCPLARNQSASGNDEQYACCVYFCSNLLREPWLSHPETSVWNNRARLFSFSSAKTVATDFVVFFTFPCCFRQLPWSRHNFLLFEVSCFQFRKLTRVSLACEAHSIVKCPLKQIKWSLQSVYTLMSNMNR